MDWSYFAEQLRRLRPDVINVQESEIGPDGLAAATEVLFHIPLAVGHPRYAECLHRVSTEIAPRLHPAQRAGVVSSSHDPTDRIRAARGQ
ncbi:hypothetical protein [Nocardia barduliensis]|uniref:hypothetical protein n=1 Tax=Nocardia barduliensis TaxID=2736643 RepID=UPI0015748B3F|nr:hypothetical protein [Nocardia barduliensis]